MKAMKLWKKDSKSYQNSGVILEIQNRLFVIDGCTKHGFFGMPCEVLPEVPDPKEYGCNTAVIPAEYTTSGKVYLVYLSQKIFLQETVYNNVVDSLIHDGMILAVPGQEMILGTGTESEPLPLEREGFIPVGEYLQDQVKYLGPWHLQDCFHTATGMWLVREKWDCTQENPDVFRIFIEGAVGIHSEIKFTAEWLAITSGHFWLVDFQVKKTWKSVNE